MNGPPDGERMSSAMRAVGNQLTPTNEIVK
jgi:hypothetical protein